MKDFLDLTKLKIIRLSSVVVEQGSIKWEQSKHGKRGQDTTFNNGNINWDLVQLMFVYSRLNQREKN